MPVLLLIIAFQIACAVHCVRQRRNQMWLMVIIFLPVAGSLAYAFFEILPGFAGRREVRAVKRVAARDVRRARDALETAGP